MLITLFLSLLLLLLLLPTMESMEKPSLPLEATDESRVEEDRWAVRVAERMEVQGEAGVGAATSRRRGGGDEAGNTDMSSTTVMAT